jgi:hypothetical protein
MKTSHKTKLLGLGLVVSMGLGMLGASAQATSQILADAHEAAEMEAIAGEDPLDSCVLLEEVTTGQTEIRKRIENRIITQGNWSTDFVVPSVQEFSYFVAILSPEHNAPYELIVNFKHRDAPTVEQVYSNRADLEEGEVYAIPLQSSTNRQPFQVNTRVGGTNGDVYTIAVAACTE